VEGAEDEARSVYQDQMQLLRNDIRFKLDVSGDVNVR
jgi:hypothetical protein